MAQTQRPNVNAPAAKLVSLDEARKLIAAEQTKARTAGKIESIPADERALIDQCKALREARDAAKEGSAERKELTAKLKAADNMRKAKAFVRKAGVCFVDTIKPLAKTITALGGPNYIATEEQRRRFVEMALAELEPAFREMVKVPAEADDSENDGMTPTERKRAARKAAMGLFA